MKLTFITPYYHNIWEALGIGYIASYCKCNFKGSLSMNFFHGNFDDKEEMMDDARKADVVCFSCTSPTYRQGVELAREIHRVNNKARIVFGGWHVSTMRKIEDEVIDQIVIGEGEDALVRILDGDSSEIVDGKRLGFDELKWPDREIIKYKRQVNWCEEEFGERIASIQSVRGCKMHCAMCGERYMSGEYDSKTNPLRLRDPEDTVDELEFLQNYYDINRFKFVDPTWSVTEEYVSSFCEKKISKGIKLPWDAMVHAGIATESMLKIMKSANCDTIMVGCESGSQSLLNEMHKGVTIEKIKKIFEWGRKYGLNRRAFFMIGMPNETVETIQDTVILIEEIDPDVVGFTILAPYPGTEFYDEDKFKDVDWSKVDEYSNDIWRSIQFSNSELKHIQKMLCDLFKDKIPWHQQVILGEHHVS